MAESSSRPTSEPAGELGVSSAEAARGAPKPRVCSESPPAGV